MLMDIAASVSNQTGRQGGGIWKKKSYKIYVHVIEFPRHAFLYLLPALLSEVYSHLKSIFLIIHLVFPYLFLLCLNCCFCVLQMVCRLISVLEVLNYLYCLGIMCVAIVYSSGVSDYVASVLFCWECPLLINSLDSLIMACIQMMYIQIPIVSTNLDRI